MVSFFSSFNEITLYLDDFYLLSVKILALLFLLIGKDSMVITVYISSGVFIEKKYFPFYLQNYQASVDDLNKVLLIDPNVLEAKNELEQVTQLLNLGSSAVTGSLQKQRKKITIQEVYLFIFKSKQYRSHTFEKILLKVLFCSP